MGLDQVLADLCDDLVVCVRLVVHVGGAKGSVQGALQARDVGRYVRRLIPLNGDLALSQFQVVVDGGEQALWLGQKFQNLVPDNALDPVRLDASSVACGLTRSRPLCRSASVLSEFPVGAERSPERLPAEADEPSREWVNLTGLVLPASADSHGLLQSVEALLAQDGFHLDHHGWAVLPGCSGGPVGLLRATPEHFADQLSFGQVPPQILMGPWHSLPGEDPVGVQALGHLSGSQLLVNNPPGHQAQDRSLVLADLQVVVAPTTYCPVAVGRLLAPRPAAALRHCVLSPTHPLHQGVPVEGCEAHQHVSHHLAARRAGVEVGLDHDKADAEIF